MSCPRAPPNFRTEPLLGRSQTRGVAPNELLSRSLDGTPDARVAGYLKVGNWVWTFSRPLKYLTFLRPVPFILKTLTPRPVSKSLQ